MFVPLSGIMDELVENKVVATAAVNMNGKIYTKVSEGQLKVSDEDILAGKYVRLVMHPEALQNSNIEKLLLKMKMQQQILGVVVDEFHVILPVSGQQWRSRQRD